MNQAKYDKANAELASLNAEALWRSRNGLFPFFIQTPMQQERMRLIAEMEAAINEEIDDE